MADQARDAAAGTVATGPAATAGRARKVGYRTAAQILAERDPVIARLVEAAQACRKFPRRPRPTSPPWSARSPTSGWPGPRPGPSTGRLIQALDSEATPERLLATPTETPQASGLGGRRPRFTISPSSSAHRLLHSASGPRMPSSTPSCSSNAVS